MRYISLFSGIGGFDLGLDRAGMECIAQVEKDKKARSVLNRHWSKVRRFHDAKEFGRNSISADADLICGGFPCQDLSVAGKRAGLAGERSGLFYEFMRIIGEFSPTWILIENVPGLLSSNEGKDMGIVTESLVQFGYGWAYRILDSRYFGVPQRRRRIFIVAHSGNKTERAAKVLFEQESVYGNHQSGQSERRDSAGSVNGDFRESDKPVIVIKGASIGRSPDAGPQWGSIREDNYSYTLTTDEVHIAAINWQQSATSNRTRITRGGDYTGALTVGKQDAIFGDIGLRRFTPIECERLQGFPDNWTEGQFNTTRYKQIGNAVTVPVSEWIGKRIIKVNKENQDEINTL